MSTKEIAAGIRKGAALAFFATAWAEMVEEKGATLRGDIMELIPEEIDPAAVTAVDKLIKVVTANFDFREPGLNDSQKLACLYLHSCRLAKAGADREITPELFGHYLAMQAMGTGVGMESFGYEVRDYFDSPFYVEFSFCNLERDYDYPA
jgi:hypothetical protein